MNEARMDIDTYTAAVDQTWGAGRTDQGTQLSYCALGLAGETGEVVELIKKAVHHGLPLRRDDLIQELGDVAWYLTAACLALNVPLSEVMRINRDKLAKRYPDGFVLGGGNRKEPVT